MLRKLSEFNFSRRFLETVTLLIQKEINRLLKKAMITKVSKIESGCLSSIFS